MELCEHICGMGEGRNNGRLKKMVFGAMGGKTGKDAHWLKEWLKT